MVRILLLSLFSFALWAADTSDAIHALLSKYHEQGWFNGSALVADNGAVIFKRGYGMANMEWSIANTPDTKFRLGSVTKQFTAALVLQLVEQGKVDLNAPLTRYLPDYPAKNGDRITVHQLLNHTSGIPGYTELPQFREWALVPSTPAAFVAKFSKLELLFQPGTKYSYSNSAFFVAGYLVEKITGKSYADVLRERIFEPLGMRDSGYDLPSTLLSKRASGYDVTFDGYRNAGYIDMTLPYAAGSLYSTVEDLYKWDQGLYGDVVLKPASKEKMFTPGLANQGYGFVVQTRNGVKTISHGGAINGFNSVIVREPDTKRLVVLLNNAGGAPLQEMESKIREILRGGPAPAMPKPQGAPVLLRTYQSSGIQAVLAQIQSDSVHDMSEGQLSRLAGHLLSVGKPRDALALAKAIVERNPKSANAATLLARAHQATGNRVEALQSYGRALELSETPRAFPMISDEIRKLSVLELNK
jgi:CubicO group peptidase (beta-lactamase class C family)